MQATSNNSQANSNSTPAKAPNAKQPKASKPVAPKATAKGQPKANGKAKQQAAPVAPAPKQGNRPGPKAGQQRVTVLGYSLYGFSQWVAQQGYPFVVCQALLAKLAQNGQPNMATVKTAYSDVKNPKYSRPAPVSPAHAKQVAGLVKASQPKAPKASKTAVAASN